MAKRKEEEPPKGAPAWQSTFADLMNLLLCFFVLLFSMSTIDAQKFEAIASSFSNTFSIFSAGGSSFDDGLLISNGVSQLNNLDQYINNTGAAAEQTTENNDMQKDESSGSDSEAEELKEQLEAEQLKASEELAEKMSEALEEGGINKDVDIDFTSQYVQLTLKGSVLFDSGKSEIKEEALPLIAKIATILERYAQSTIEIEGHTDNVPISTGRYESNDVLSSYRALSMFDYLVQNTTLDPAKIKHSGRGEYCPVADNSTPEGRAKNRRIEIKIYNNLSSD